MRPRIVGLAVLLCLAMLSGAADLARAQSQTTGTIRGQVESTEGAPVANAQVVAVNVDTGLRRGTLADKAGKFAILLLPPGTYRVEVQSIGFTTAVAQEVNVRIGEASPLSVELVPAAVALEAVTVIGERARIDPTQGGVAQTVTPEQVEHLPTQGRDFTDLINLSPLVSPQPGVGTGGQFSIAGARTSGTNVQVDGVDANNVFFGENRGSSRTPFAFSLESIKELQLITNGFDVEYGNYVGGVVNAVTKGGTNEFQGGGFYFFRDEALTADDFSGQAPEAFQAQQFGVNFSGPIIRDKMHFFVSADVQRKDQPVFAVTPEVSGIPQGTISEFIGVLGQQGVTDPERFFGVAEQAEDNLVLFGRVDWQLGSNNRLTVRQNFSDFEQTNDRVSTRGEEALTHAGPFRNEVWSTVAELNSVLSPRAFNTLRFQWSAEDRPRVPNELGFLPEIDVEVGGEERIEFGGDGIIFRNRLQEDKLQLIDNFTYQAGAHTFKIGTNNSLSTIRNTFFLLGNGEFRFESIEDLRANRPESFFRFIRPCPVPLEANQAGQPVICPELDVPFAEFDAVEWSVYAQDDWQVTDRLLVTPGLRYGGTSFLDDPAAVPQVEQRFTDPLTGNQLRTGFLPSFAGLSPRLAFTYDVSGNESNLLRGGVGLLVGRAPGVLVGNVFQTERPLLVVFCAGDDVPAFNLRELLASPTGLNNPAACAGGQAPSGRPDFTFFSEEFELPRTLKTNLGYEQVLGTDTKVGVDLIYSRTWNNFSVRDLNLRDPAFRLADGRPVFVPQNRFNPARRAGSDRLRDRAFNRVFLNVAEAEAEAWNVAVELDQPVGETLQFGLRYAYNRAFDNSSFSCCISQEGLEIPTAGDPNFLGDIGDEDEGTFGPSDFERRHTIVGNFLYEGPFGVLATGIVRLQSGTPFTPIVDGDINADALDENDRAFLGENLRFASAEDQALFDQFLNENECLREQFGRIVRRNSCRNPWFNSVDLRLAKLFDTVGDQRLEVILDLFNVLNGINSDWGRFVGVIGDNQKLLVAEGFDRATNEVIFSVNPSFGEAVPLGFDPFQFQAQLGIRYRF